MSAEQRTKYRAFCKKVYIPIFSQGWWLDAVCGQDNWDVVLYEKGGKVAGAWPFAKNVTLGQQMLDMPVLTKFLGIYIDYPENMNSTTKGSYEKEVITALQKQLPYKHLDQNFHYSFSNWLPLYWAGLSQTTNYSYYIDNLDAEAAYKNFKSSLKRDIKKAEKDLQVIETNDPQVLFKLVQSTFEAKDKVAPYSLELLTALDQICNEKNCRKILLAQDENKNVHAGIYLVWDDRSYYYLIAGSNPEYKGSNANSLLIWHGIQDACRAGKLFDFEGSMIASIERYFRSFGAIQRPYFKIKHSSPKWLKLYFFLKTLRS